MMTWRLALARLLHRPDEPMFVDLADRQRRQRIADAEYQAALDAQSAIVRTSSYCRRLPRRQVPAVIERIKGRL